MPITRNEARELCNDREYSLVAESFVPEVRKFSAAQLKKKVEVSRSHADKWRDQLEKQERDAKKAATAKTSPGAKPLTRTRKKARIFQETLQRFEKRLGQL